MSVSPSSGAPSPRAPGRPLARASTPSCSPKRKALPCVQLRLRMRRARTPYRIDMSAYCVYKMYPISSDDLSLFTL